MIEVKAPNEAPKRARGSVSIFLAGSIEMNTAEPWHQRLCDELSDIEDLVIYNPRRESWDSSWTQEKENPQFNEQVTWELNKLDSSDVIALYFDPNTKSPITLLELGLHVTHPGLIVLCPEGYWRKGNVDIVCERHGVVQATCWEDFVNKIRDEIDKAERDRLLGAMDW
jgi:hypothetical protein